MRVGGDGNAHLLELHEDLAAKGHLDALRFAALADDFTVRGDEASADFWSRDMGLGEMRDAIAWAFVEACRVPRRYELLVGLWPRVLAVRARKDLREVLGDEELDARSLLWGLALAFTFATLEGEDG